MRSRGFEGNLKMERSVEEVVEAMKLLWAVHTSRRMKAVPLLVMAAKDPELQRFVDEVMATAFTSGFVTGIAWALEHQIPFDQRFLCDEGNRIVEVNREAAFKAGIDMSDIDLPMSATRDISENISEALKQFNQAEKEYKETGVCNCAKCRAMRGTDGPIPDLYAEEKMDRINTDLSKAIKETLEKHGCETIEVNLYPPHPQG